MDYVERYAEMLRHKKQRFELIEGQLFLRNGNRVVPLGPAGQEYVVDAAQCRELLRSLGGLWVQWTDGFGTQGADTGWYALVCRRFVPVEEMDSHSIRKQIRRGLTRCEVRQVEAEEIAQNGYDTYCAAVRGYGQQSRLPTRDEFHGRVMSDAPFGDIRHHWAAYHKGRLIGFNQNLVYDDIEVDYTQGKYHPDYLKCYPSYALHYQMNEFYLAQKKLHYIYAGSRSISHETQIQDFLTRNFNFTKVPVGLHVHYRPAVGVLLRLARPFQGIVGQVVPKVGALFELERLRQREQQPGDRTT